MIKNPITGLISFLFLVTLFSCSQKDTGFMVSIPSPDLNIHTYFALEKGKPFYMIYFRDEMLVRWSPLGYVYSDDDPATLRYYVESTESGTHSEEWNPVWGQTSLVVSHYNEYTIHLRGQHGKKRPLSICFRVFNDGVGFRYSFPAENNSDSLFIVNELTGFTFAEDGTAWWIPGDFDSDEHLYRTTSLSEVASANTPFTLKLKNGMFLSVHEANLVNYPGMVLKRTDSTGFVSDLAPWPDGHKVKAKPPFYSSWRTIQIAPTAGDLITSNLIMNLNEPNVIDDVSWISPMNYIGIWWGMHLGINTWHEGPRHGATTARTKQYIDFAANHNIGGVLVEGWNVGWDNWSGGDSFDFVTPYPGFDLSMLAAYAAEKGVQLIGHHETGGHALNYEKHIDSAFALYESLGIHAVKTGYAGRIRPEGHYHHGQWMVNHYQKVVELAAKHRIMVNVHEPIKPTGVCRTYPNLMTGEGVRGMEWNAWSDGNPPEHTTIIPFTRMLAGPVDYTPGIFDLMLNKHSAERRKWNAEHSGDTRVHSTLANQLALYVVLFSPMQMAADLIENYANNPAFGFIEQIPATWDDTRVLHAEPGDFVTIARKNGNRWFIGSVTDEKERALRVPLDFLNPGVTYRLTIYEDGKDADWRSAPIDIIIRDMEVDNTGVLDVRLAAGGGFAAIAVPAR